MIDDCSVVSHGLPDGEDGDLQEGEQLANDQPDVDHPDVGGGGQLLHNTVTRPPSPFGMILNITLSDLTKSVVVTNITVRFTVTAASK